jgi:Tol biopolymer transport system component
MEATDDTGYGIVVLDLETGKTWKAGPGMSGFAWSPDKKLMIACAGIGRLETPKGGVIYVMPAEGGTITQIDLGKGIAKGEIMSVDWSPDGKRIVFDVMSQIFETYLMRNLIPKEGK